MKHIQVLVFSMLLYISLSCATSQENTFKQFPNLYFVETGCYEGDGIAKALSAGFEHVYSVELSSYYYELSKKRFSSNPKVKLVQGDSGDVLYEAIKDINSTITFWLDGHFCGGLTGQGVQNCPVLRELEQIKKHHIKNHTILIDDVRLFGSPSFNYIALEHIIAKLLEINPNYDFFYVDGAFVKDILVAQVH